ncbi:hypothetical protein PtA15_6A75 [Puccinia triticina]|uniref:Uncharacterized protein n=1 Tax=Puccinia triticina TaxID=208348 RepID=A0ABY7CLT7_9BASI|nr:uncharacterized protein PtA15_6A75 [Puccinia triticina]WAQ85447.1 hypothetical protein PtA15_6A75 [Puccinia triticina]WAR55331.1 hypothetical protein PtB15_6B70 [Puccinia triticina]
MPRESTADLLADAFRGLADERWRTVGADIIEGPKDEKVLTAEEIGARQAHLAGLQTGLLPSLGQQLGELMGILDIEALGKDPGPRPRLAEAVELVAKLGRTLDQLNISAHALAPLSLEAMAAPSRIDHDYGALKSFRCRPLLGKIQGMVISKVRGLARHYGRLLETWRVFEAPLPATPGPSDSDSDEDDDHCFALQIRDKIVDGTAAVSGNIADIIRWSQRSDFALLQDEWQAQVGLLTFTLDRLAARIDATVRPREEGEGSRRDSGGEVAGDDGAAAAAEDDQVSVGVEFGYSSRPVPVSRELLPLSQRTVALVKLGRIFLCKLVGRPAFELDGRLSSAELAGLEGATGSIDGCLLSIAECVADAAGPAELRAQLADVLRWADELAGRLDSAVLLLAFHLVPRPTRPLHHLFREWLPIAPELISRKLRQHQLLKHHHPPPEQEAIPPPTPAPRPPPAKSTIPVSAKPKAPHAQRSFSSQTAAQRHRERSKSTANQLSIPPTTKAILRRPILAAEAPRHTAMKDKATTVPARNAHPKGFKLRPRSMSASSLRDPGPSIPGALPPWTTDPSPRIYRVDPAANNSPLNGSDFKPPSHDDLILPTVARQIEKQTKLLTPTDHPTFSSVSSNFSQWEALGPQLLLRKASLKRLEGAFAHPSTLSVHEPLSSPTPDEELIDPITPDSGRSRAPGDDGPAGRRMSRRMSGSQGAGPADDRRASRRLSAYLSASPGGRRGSQTSASSASHPSPSAARRVLGNAPSSHQPLASDDGCFEQARHLDPEPEGGCCKCVIV